MRQRVNIRPRGVTADTILVVTASEHVYDKDDEDAVLIETYIAVYFRRQVLRPAINDTLPYRRRL